MNIANWLTRAAQKWPEREAVFEGSELRWNYEGFYAAVESVAGWLSARDLNQGDRIAIFAQNIPEYLIAKYAIWTMGGVAVPINAKLHEKEAAYIIENSEASLVLTCSKTGEGAFPVPSISMESVAFQDALSFSPRVSVVSREPEDLAWLFYTSGTTGRPKGVMITHRMLMSMALNYSVDVDPVAAQDRALYAAPLSHGAGIYSVQHVLMGAGHVVPVSRGFEPEEVLDLASLHKNAHMFLAPTMVQRMTTYAVEHGRTGEGLKTIVYGGGPMYVADILKAVDHFGPVFAQIYGQGECPMAISAMNKTAVADRAHPNWQARLLSVGRAQSSVEVQIGDEVGAALPNGTIGEIMVRGDTVMPGYWKNEAANAKTLVNGWLMTGDMGSMDTDGFITMKDRSKDMIISGGTNIYPREVEEALLTHKDVEEVSVIGAPDEEWGESVVAFVVLKSNALANEQTLDQHCLENIARFKRPKRYVFVDTLPKNNYGKVLKTALREQLTQL
jgi:long-chain acyl-CoA synthetase